MEKKLVGFVNDMDKLTIKGLHLDLSRHFLPCKTILEIVKVMQTLGFNTLHLHFSDDPAFALKSSRHPEITNERTLSIQEQEEIASVCLASGIDIIPEIDIPGHATALLHCLHPSLPVEEQLGVVTSTYIDIDNDLPIILDLFEEYATRFHSRFIHMGGDEADGFMDLGGTHGVGYTHFAKLLQLVSVWAHEHGLWVIAWDECAKHLAQLPEKLDNFVIQNWRMVRLPKEIPMIISSGYYLDHLDDPIDYYNRFPKQSGPNIGCIACTWTEMIDEQNIWCSLLPTLYMLALRWNEFPAKREHLPLVLFEMCEKYGYPQVFPGMDNTWKTRLFVDFYQDHPRSITSLCSSPLFCLSSTVSYSPYTLDCLAVCL